VKYCVIDLETNGADFYNDRITEIACVFVEDGEILQRYTDLIDSGQHINEEIARYTGITTDMLRVEGVDLRDAMRRTKQIVDNAELIVGHNVIMFDRRFLIEEGLRSGIFDSNSWPLTKFVDTAALFKAYKLGSRKLTNEPHWKFAQRVLNRRVYGLKYNLKFACEDFGISLKGVEFHRALADAFMTYKLFEELKKRGLYA
jgi:DNA polymerase III epsilon subunit-like protein